MIDAAASTEFPGNGTKEIVRTEPLSKTERRLVVAYQEARGKVRSLIRQSESIAKQIETANGALPKASSELCNALAIRFGHASYAELKAQGFDIVVDSKGANAALVRVAP